MADSASHLRATSAQRTPSLSPFTAHAPDIMGQGIANPLGAILSAAMMLDYLKLADAAARVRRAVNRTLEQNILTRDVGGSATTEEMTRAVIENL